MVRKIWKEALCIELIRNGVLNLVIIMLPFSYLGCYTFNYECCVGKREKNEKLELKVQSFSVSFTCLNQFYWRHR